MRVDHVIYAAPGLDAAVAEVDALVGVRAAGGGQHTGQGTHNRLLALGAETYLEIVAPDPTQPEPAAPRPYGVNGVTSGRLVGWALRTDDIERSLAHARARGFDPGDIIEGHRLTPSGALLRWRITNNALTAGVIPFLIDWGDTPHPASSAPVGIVLRSLQIEHPDPASIAEPLLALGAEVTVRPARTAALVLKLHGPAGPVELR